MTGQGSAQDPSKPGSGYPGQVGGDRSPAGPIAVALGVAAGVAALRARSTPTPRRTQVRRSVSSARSRAGKAPRQAARARRAAGATTTAALRLPPRAVASTADAVSHRAHHAANTWSRTLRRTLLAAVTATGYVLGSKAGRERYEALMGKGRELLDRPQAQPLKDELDQATKAEPESTTTSYADGVPLVPAAELYPVATAPVMDPVLAPVLDPLPPRP